MTNDELKTNILASGQRFLPVHRCSMCDYKCGFIIIENDIIAYDNGCYCVRERSISPRTWNDIYEHYNMQSDEGKGHVLKSWKLLDDNN